MEKLMQNSFNQNQSITNNKVLSQSQNVATQKPTESMYTNQNVIERMPVTNTQPTQIQNTVKDEPITISKSNLNYERPIMNYPNYNVVSNDTQSNSCTDRKAQEEMMMKIKELNFTVIELALYLDTHPEDERALCMHKEACKKLKDIKDKYQKVYGPLSIYYPCNKWRWLEEPWPWERGSC